MDHSTLSPNQDDPTSELKPSTKLGWPEFFQELDHSTVTAEGGVREGSRISTHERLLYASENGDRWSLARDPGNGRVFVRHRPNLPSGGQAGDIELGAFLVQGGLGPEKQALLRLIGGLIDGAQGDGSEPTVS